MFSGKNLKEVIFVLVNIPHQKRLPSILVIVSKTLTVIVIFTKMLIVDVIVTISFMIVIILIVAKCLALNLSCLLNEIYFHKFLNI